MTLVQSWIDSLRLLKPKNLQLFAMVTLKSIIEAYKLMFKYFWWLVLVIAAFLLFVPDYRAVIYAHDIANIAFYAQMTGIAYLLYTLLLLAVCFITRPSVVKKDCNYFRTQYKKIILYWLLWVILLTISSVKMVLTPLLQISAYSPWWIFLVLFYVDSEGGWNNLFLSMWRTLKMIIFNYPLLIVMGICFYLPIFIVNKHIFISPLMRTFLSSLLLPIGVCTFANIYIKKLHDQFDLYFKPVQ